MNMGKLHPIPTQGATTSDLMRMKSAATYLGCSVPTIYRAMSKHRLPARRMGGHWVFSKTELDAWVQSLPGVNQPSAS